jgi:hypothetical protein
MAHQLSDRLRWRLEWDRRPSPRPAGVRLRQALPLETSKLVDPMARIRIPRARKSNRRGMTLSFGRHLLAQAENLPPNARPPAPIPDAAVAVSIASWASASIATEPQNKSVPFQLSQAADRRSHPASGRGIPLGDSGHLLYPRQARELRSGQPPAPAAIAASDPRNGGEVSK